MTDEDRLADLLLHWDELREQGQDVSAEELCRDWPHLVPALARRIHALKATSWLANTEEDDGQGPSPEGTGPDDPPRRTLAGRYRLDGRIAEGGFAEVWRGYDQELRRAVAVKMPKANRLAGSESVERFVAEARRAARLKHPGVVPVFDVGRDGDSCFIVSELVEGGSLADRLANARPSPHEAARLIAEVAETLAYAHRQGFVHRDIKPANILLDHHGRALLADFGIARSPEDGAEDGAGSFGTLAYMSPELLQGQPADHRSDIYSLGVVLYELLAGHLPHSGSDPVDLRRQIVSGSVAALPGVSNELEKICLKCLKREPADRYRDADELAADLQRVVVSIPRSRRRLAVRIGLFLALAALAALLILPLRHKSSREQADGTEITTKADEEPSAALEAALALGKLHFNKNEWDRADAAFTEAIRLNPECAEAYHRRAGSRFNTGRVMESLSDFDTAAQLDPTNAEIFKNRGIAYLNLLRFDEALADLRHGLQLDPDHPQPYRLVLGQTYARRAFEHAQAKKWTEAIADLTAAIPFSPTSAEYFDKRGSCHYNLRHYEEACKDFSEAIRLNSRQPAYHLHRGYAYQALGRAREAADDFKEAQSEPASQDGK
jgi:tetratricopeptide (TPR) repeat protein/tRNA A-37 threonylcarbamoyl transferase component Bud32